MKHLWVILLLQGCIVDNYNYDIKHQDVLYVGDSLCYKAFDTDTGIDGIYENEDYQRTAQAMTGIKSNCVPGRKLMDITSIQSNRIVFLALGTNDVGKTNINDFRARYQDLVYNTEADIMYCVLPAKKIGNKDSSEYRQVIEETCANVINPADYGVKFRAKDGVHMTELDHKLWVKAIRERI